MEQTHIIHKLNIDIDVPDLNTARRIYHDFLEIWKERILPELEKRLNQTISNEKNFRFDQLNIQLTTDTAEQIEESLSVSLAGKLVHFSKNNSLPESIKIINKQQLAFENNSNNEEETISHVTNHNETIVNAFFYFLQYGQLPWYVISKNSWTDEEQIIQAFLATKEKYKHLLVKIFLENSQAAKRLLLQFTMEFFIFIIAEITGIEQNEIAAIIKTEVKEIDIINFFQQQLKSISDNVLKTESNSFTTEKQIDDPGKQITDIEITDSVEKNLNPAIKQATSTVAKDKKETEKQHAEENELYIQYGGLILLHPFLQYFFKQFNLVTDEGFINEEAKETAIHLLYYLATGNENAYEHELGFIKYLCNWPQQFPLHRFIKISDEMKAESENMLNAVIRHWKILKNTSSNGLRESFLQRNGKLILSDQQHKIILEKNSIDILLEHIPWNHSIISLPWMKKILYAEW